MQHGLSLDRKSLKWLFICCTLFWLVVLAGIAILWW